MPSRLQSQCVGMSFIFAMTLSVTPAMSGSLSGPVNIVDGRNLVVAGQTVALDGIAVPGLGEPCSLRGKQMDCGVLARAGLMDITAGAQVICDKVSATTYRCRADGYDIGYGQIHAGWAVARDSAPGHYYEKMQDARRNKRGLWAAQSPNSAMVFALTLTR